MKFVTSGAELRPRRCVVNSYRFLQGGKYVLQRMWFGITAGAGLLPQCGRPRRRRFPRTGLEFELQNYAGKIKALAVVWYIYAAFCLLTGIVGLAFANAFFSGRFGLGCKALGQRPHAAIRFMPAILHFAWVFLVLRAAWLWPPDGA